MSLHVPEDGSKRVLRNVCRCSATNAMPHSTQHGLSTPQLNPQTRCHIPHSTVCQHRNWAHKRDATFHTAQFVNTATEPTNEMPHSTQHGLSTPQLSTQTRYHIPHSTICQHRNWAHKRDATFHTAQFVNTATEPTNEMPHSTQHNLSTPQLSPTAKFWCTHFLTLFLIILHYWLRFPLSSLCTPSFTLQSLTSILFPSVSAHKNRCVWTILRRSGPVYNVYRRLLPCAVSACGGKIRVDAPCCSGPPSSSVTGTGLPPNYRRVECRVSAYCGVKPRLYVSVVWRKVHPPGVDGRIILRWIFNKWDVGGVWTGSSWMRIGTGGGHEPSGSIKCWEFLG